MMRMECFASGKHILRKRFRRAAFAKIALILGIISMASIVKSAETPENEVEVTEDVVVDDIGAPKKKKKKKKKKKSAAATEDGGGKDHEDEGHLDKAEACGNSSAKVAVKAPPLLAPGETACSGCGKASTMRCPTCTKLGVPSQLSMFCSQSCFKENWITHKNFHKMYKSATKAPPADKAYEASAGDLDIPPSFRNYSFTGNYRPAKVTSMRSVPASIPRPDYADDGLPRGEMKERGNKRAPVRSADQLRRLRLACIAGRDVLDTTGRAIKAGITGEELDRICHNRCVELGGYPSPLNYHNFPKSICVSPNEVICHGIPNCRPIKNGDIVNLDVTIFIHGMHADLNETFLVGDVDDEAVKLVKNAYDCMQVSGNMIKPGTMYRSLGDEIHKKAQEQKFQVVKTYCGHGIGDLFHTAPNVPHYKKNKAIGVMAEGHTFTIEPMINQGTWRDTTWPDDWTAVTVDGKWSAQYEHTFLCTTDGVDVLTAKPEADTSYRVPDWRRDWFQR